MFSHYSLGTSPPSIGYFEQLVRLGKLFSYYSLDSTFRHHQLTIFEQLIGLRHLATPQPTVFKLPIGLFPTRWLFMEVFYTHQQPPLGGGSWCEESCLPWRSSTSVENDALPTLDQLQTSGHRSFGGNAPQHSFTIFPFNRSNSCASST